MICYKDRTWCNDHHCARYNKDCDRSLTQEVMEQAIEWWGGEDPPIMMFVARPQCFESKIEG